MSVTIAPPSVTTLAAKLLDEEDDGATELLDDTELLEDEGTTELDDELTELEEELLYIV